MDNYVYIVSSLPVLSQDWKAEDGWQAEEIVSEIKGQLSGRDNKVVDKLLDGFKDDKLNADFYKDAAAYDQKFIRDYFSFDLDVRNAKVRYLNQALGRPADMDVITLAEDEERDFEEADKLDAILHGDDILRREKGLDDLMWEKIDALTMFHYFDLDIILGFISKLHIIDRWMKLDEKTGREMFSKLVDEVRATFKGVEMNN